MRFDPLDPSTWQAPLPRRRRQPSRPARPPRPRFPRTARAARELGCALESARRALQALEDAEAAGLGPESAAWAAGVAAWEQALHEAVWHAADAVVTLHAAISRGEPRWPRRTAARSPATEPPEGERG